MMRSMTPWSRSGSPLSLLTNTAIGTPQARWRDTHQSGRVLIMPFKRFLPVSGTKRVSSMALSALSRSAMVSMEMNHCVVLRKINGAFERQEWG